MAQNRSDWENPPIEGQRGDPTGGIVVPTPQPTPVYDGEGGSEVPDIASILGAIMPMFAGMMAANQRMMMGMMAMMQQPPPMPEIPEVEAIDFEQSIEEIQNKEAARAATRAARMYGTGQTLHAPLLKSDDDRPSLLKG